MNEPILELSRESLSARKEVVRVFYKEMWDHADVSLVPRIFHSDFTFRGSLGPVLVGHAQFIDYVRQVTETFGSYTSDILLMAEERDLLFAKLRFHGIHRREIFGVSPTHRHVWWYGMPVFRFDGDKVRDLWVLGDVHNLIGRLTGAADGPQDSDTPGPWRDSPADRP